jgi:hypothetical protein
MRVHLHVSVVHVPVRMHHGHGAAAIRRG